MSVTAMQSKKQCDSLLAAAGADTLVVINFWASWAPSCEQMNLVTVELSKKFTWATFLTVEAEKLHEISEGYSIDSVPTILLLKGGKELARLTGADVPTLAAKVELAAGPPPAGGVPPASGAASSPEDLNVRLGKLVSASQVVLFM